MAGSGLGCSELQGGQASRRVQVLGLFFFRDFGGGRGALGVLGFACGTWAPSCNA